MNKLGMIFSRPMDVVVAHAARANKEVDLLEEKPLSRFTTLQSTNGDYLDPKDYFIVRASGTLLASQGIDDGARLVARRVTPEILPKIAPGAFVVVNEPSSRISKAVRQLKVFAGLDGDQATFKNDEVSEDHGNQPASEIVGVVTHVVP